MTTLTPEQRQLVERAGTEPVRLTDPLTDDTYYLIKEEVYERIRDAIAPKSEIDPGIPEGIKRSQAAFLRDLPGLLNNKKMVRKWVAYHGDQRIGIARTQQELIRDCLRLGLRDDAYYLDMILPYPTQPEVVEGGPYEFEEVIPGDPEPRS
jgi:hypothetical protein